jgi:hypothetical protein
MYLRYFSIDFFQLKFIYLPQDQLNVKENTLKESATVLELTEKKSLISASNGQDFLHQQVHFVLFNLIFLLDISHLLQIRFIHH